MMLIVLYLCDIGVRVGWFLCVFVLVLVQYFGYGFGGGGYDGVGFGVGQVQGWGKVDDVVLWYGLCDYVVFQYGGDGFVVDVFGCIEKLLFVMVVYQFYGVEYVFVLDFVDMGVGVKCGLYLCVQIVVGFVGVLYQFQFVDQLQVGDVSCCFDWMGGIGLVMVQYVVFIGVLYQYVLDVLVDDVV